MANKITSLSFVLFTCCCPHLLICMLASNGISASSMNFAREINAFKKFSARNFFVRKRNDESFPRELFGVEINANENKANYGMHSLCVHGVCMHTYTMHTCMHPIMYVCTYNYACMCVHTCISTCMFIISFSFVFD